MPVDVLILLFIAWMWFWDYPADFPGKRMVARISRPFLWLGLWHNWAMFAPDPIRVNRRLKALIRYDDGTADEWRPIEPRQSGWLLDLLWFRQFKYQFSSLSDANRVLWKPLCDWLMQQGLREGATVTSVRLIREYQFVQPPGSATPLSEWKAAVFHEQRSADAKGDHDENGTFA